MRWMPWGDAGGQLEDLDASPIDWYRTLEAQRPAGVRAVVPALDSVWLEVEPGFDPATLPQTADPFPPAQARLHEVPCRWTGPDLDAVALARAVSPGQLALLMQEATFEVAAVGFQPGFPYLRGLPRPLHGCPRLAEPRTRVPAGSIALQGDLVGIYPTEGPGGWNLIGTTEGPICDPDRDHFPLSPGDRVRFVPA